MKWEKANYSGIETFRLFVPKDSFNRNWNLGWRGSGTELYKHGRLQDKDIYDKRVFGSPYYNWCMSELGYYPHCWGDAWTYSIFLETEEHVVLFQLKWC
jgi:hypothetical protein